MANGKKKTYLRNVGEIATLRYTYERVARERAKSIYCNIHSQNAYQQGYMDAVDTYIKPKKRSEDKLADDSMLEDIID